MKKSIEEGAVKCPQCNGRSVPSKIDVEGFEVLGWRCSKCNYEIISPKDIEKAYLLLKARKREKVKIAKRGHSYMITIPKTIAKALGIEKVTTAEIFLKDKRTITVEI
ncbi:MAG: AbrB/MazE/SpoVT family DNA-binding domain-containing protein [Candidatus Thermoplasmatota archaeon]